MPDRRSARLLAPLALIAFVVVLVIVISSAGGDGSSKSSTATGDRTKTARARPRPKPTRYIVKASDTSLDSIAATTGVPTDRLIDLNPDLDPQSLVPGERIRLR